jgi:hypothetical protein
MIPLKGLTPSTLLCLSQTRTRITIDICCGVFRVQCFEMRCICSIVDVFVRLLILVELRTTTL